MRLADFIEANIEPILAEWVTFAESCGPVGESMDLTALRDHAAAMLVDIVADLRTPQTDAEQVAKSKGDAQSTGGEETAAEVHGSGRAESGFTVGEMVSEYRALRASVIRLWTSACGSLVEEDIADLMRFNEAIDQSLAESITRYATDIDRSKEMFVAILGHDLRTPIGAVIMASQFMLETGELVEPHLTLTTRIAHSARRMQRMVADLLDFTRGRLGAGVPIVREEVDLAAVLRQAVDEIRLANPTAELELDTSGDLRGSWDAGRLSQVITNLLGNAIQHGRVGATIKVSSHGEPATVVMRVRNAGTAIPAAHQAELFSPFKRLAAASDDTRQSTSLGLGLYIVERIVTSHGGTIDVQSSDDRGTVFTVRLPR